MAGLASRWAALSGQRFLLRRMDYAILGRSMPAVGDPRRTESRAFVAGCVIAVIALVGCAGMAVLRPTAGPGSAPLVMSRSSGALFVRLGDSLQPVANLASARLILNAAAVPRIVDDDRFGAASGGPMLGIPGAPQRIGEPLAPGEVRWTVCDGADGLTTVLVGRFETPPMAAPHSGVLVSAAGDGAVYLLFDGHRAAVDRADPIVARSLRLDGAAARRVSPALLTVIPEAPSITAPRITGDGPDQPPTISAVEGDLCATWSGGHVGIGTGFSGPGSTPVRLAAADGDGPAVDQVQMAPGRCADVSVTDLTGHTVSAGRYLITDAGVRFALHDAASAAALGLTAGPATAPWPLLAALPAGPELGRDTALVARDVVGAGSAP